jgi:hypothetical protein
VDEDREPTQDVKKNKNEILFEYHPVALTKRVILTSVLDGPSPALQKAISKVIGFRLSIVPISFPRRWKCPKHSV